jgi:hypothetical protein
MEVALDSAGGDVESLGDLVGVQTFSREVRDLPFAGSERSGLTKIDQDGAARTFARLGESLRPSPSTLCPAAQTTVAEHIARFGERLGCQEIGAELLESGGCCLERLGILGGEGCGVRSETGSNSPFQLGRACDDPFR